MKDVAKKSGINSSSENVTKAQYSKISREERSRHTILNHLDQETSRVSIGLTGRGHSSVLETSMKTAQDR